MALSTHDLAERGRKATEWLTRNVSACGEAQLRLLSSNRTQWLGNADSMALMGLIDSALEARVKGDPEKLARMFGAASPPPRAADDDTMRSGTLAPRPAPVVAPGTPAVASAPPVVVVPPAPGAVAPPAAGLPPGAVPPGIPTGRPPEVGRHFDEKLRGMIREYFTANRGNGPCPEGLILKDGRCESPRTNRGWTLGQAMSAQLAPKPVPPRLLERLGPAPAGHSYQLVEGDLLLVNSSTQTVVDAVLDLGQIAPRS